MYLPRQLEVHRVKTALSLQCRNLCPGGLQNENFRFCKYLEKVFLHPLTECFLFFKWHRVRLQYWAHLLCHLTFSLFYSAYLYGIWQDVQAIGISSQMEWDNLDQTITQCKSSLRDPLRRGSRQWGDKYHRCSCLMGNHACVYINLHHERNITHVLLEIKIFPFMG